MRKSRRNFLKSVLLGSSLGYMPRYAKGKGGRARVVVVGGGFGGATAAKYIRMWDPSIEVTLVEKNKTFVSCPMSNRVISGVWDLNRISKNYSKLSEKFGIELCFDEALDIDSVKREVVLSDGKTKLGYDRLIVAPGIDFAYPEFSGVSKSEIQQVIPHAWKAGPQTLLLHRQIKAMKDGGVVVISIPLAPYRCPPGPYERACQIAYYLKQIKPKSKVIILDANENIQSKKKLFKKAWDLMYEGMIEYIPMAGVVDIDSPNMTVKLDFEDVRADVINYIPPQETGILARKIGLTPKNGRWCDVNFLTYESNLMPNVHVIGDAITASPKMPKSGHMANQHAKVCAAAICAILNGYNVNPKPMLTNTCYSFLDHRNVIHVAAVYAYDPIKNSMAIVNGASGISEANTLEAVYAEGWAENIWADTLG